MRTMYNMHEVPNCIWYVLPLEIKKWILEIFLTFEKTSLKRITFSYYTYYSMYDYIAYLISQY